MPFTFPDPQVTPEFTGDNGITYAWDADDSKWQVKSSDTGLFIKKAGDDVPGLLQWNNEKDAANKHPYVGVKIFENRKQGNGFILSALTGGSYEKGELLTDLEPAKENSIVNRKYVDGKFAEWIWNGAKQSGSNYAEENILWTYIDTDTIKLNISQIPKNGQAWRYPGKQHAAVSFPINIQGMAANGKLVPILCGTTSSIRSLDFGGAPYWQVYVPASNQFIWTPNAVPNMTNVSVSIAGYFT